MANPIVNAAIITGATYRPNLSGSAGGYHASSGLLATLGGTSLAGTAKNVLSSSYEAAATAALPQGAAGKVDAFTLAAILQSTQGTGALFSSLGGSNAYETTLKVLGGAYGTSA